MRRVWRGIVVLSMVAVTAAVAQVIYLAIVIANWGRSA